MTNQQHTLSETKPINHKYNEHTVKRHITAWHESGTSLAHYCSEHNIAKSTFYGWTKKFSSKKVKGFSEVNPKSTRMKTQKPAVPITAQPTSLQTGSQSLSIQLPNGITVQLDAPSHPMQITALIKELMAWN